MESWFHSQGLGWGKVVSDFYEEGIISTDTLIAVSQNKKAMEHLVTEANPHDLHSIRQIVNPQTQKLIFEKAVIETINTRHVALQLLQSGDDPFYYAVAQGLMHPARLENILSTAIVDKGSHLLYVLRDVKNLAAEKENYSQVSRVWRYLQPNGAALVDYRVVEKKLEDAMNSSAVYKALRRRDRKFSDDDKEELKQFMYSGWLHVGKARKAIPAMPPYRYGRDRVLPAIVDGARRDYRSFKYTWKNRFSRLARAFSGKA
jgi:hypothetical protein